MKHDLTGKRSGFLEALRRGEKGWICKCHACGRTDYTVRTGHFNTGSLKSCGCKRFDLISDANTAHGHAKRRRGKRSPTYLSWCAMKKRCDNADPLNWDRYQGRGITYDQRWSVFVNFLEDMGERPAGMSLDRIDNNGNYCKANCRWATQTTQIHNRG